MDDYNINNIHYLESEILELVNKMNDKTCDKEFFSIFNGEIKKVAVIFVTR